MGTSGAAAGCTGYASYNAFVGPQTVRLAQSFNFSGGVSNAQLNWWDAVGLVRRRSTRKPA